ncbi:MAG: ABC transporter ATP-binding protein [Deltaproteobacteria bacterium]|nr:ABC transporter ATP-binding protein [Deltaproteobacteria bacterium]
MYNTAIDLDGVWAFYNGFPVLEDVSISLEQYDFLGIIGPNGGGKTTLLRIILGLIQPDKGRVSVLGGRPEENRRFIGYVPQYSDFDHEFPMSVWEMTMMGRLGHRGCCKRYGHKDKEIVANILKQMELYELKDRQIGRLSGGEKQRAFLARALAVEPRILLLDEPTASVDPHIKLGLYELLQRLNEKMTIVLVSHDIGVISSYVKKIACLNQRLFYHNSKEISREDLDAAYQCPVEMIAHGVPHRVFRKH